MAAMQTISFTDICLNGKANGGKLDGNVKKCSIYQREGRYYLGVTISNKVALEVDVRNSVAEFNYGKWDPGSEIDPILDFTFSLRSVPSWMLPYTRSAKGSLQWIYITIKAKESRLNYLAFTRVLVSLLSPLQWKKLDHDEVLALWEERFAPPMTPALKGVQLRPQLFQSFSLSDLTRLKDNESWLSDSHVTFCLLDSYQHYGQTDIWGDVTITLLDTFFWPKMSEDGDWYDERCRARVNLVGYDFIVMPMFEDKHWRLGIVERPGQLMQGETVFHILDSLPANTIGVLEASRLQKILLKHFEDAAYEEGRIKTNLAKVPRQRNGHDCGCFLIYFAKKFFSNPEGTLALIKNSFSSSAEATASWGLKSNDVSFVRTEMTALLLKYILKGDAIVEY